ncbi:MULTISPECIES: biosynthetic-type acetolactate synthase large subunit [Paenibacillus]|uniref:biosynthetic-type acetolactate synthase large subunit n=1 Tax=Paenibacillus TaxID=44249 RepID=UPI002DB91BAA|nr:biosynthetic-type acetolactate synthase large subunit [Paenibacillus odorifer]MEC0133503.1 biosynthetic-type acetolactate synthase large subunit [Paenibacillus odorifer]MEC0224822.1 biosynthetic-type acetolactate synthase large subunit [Paenibacillus odorifer]
MSGAELLVDLLLRKGISTIFGYPGGAVLPVYDALFDCEGLEHILVRHEQAAVHAADGYARATGSVGVTLVTSGPGATNAITGIATAFMDSIPLIVLTGQVPTDMIGLDSFQEVDIYGMTMSITKHNYIVMNKGDLPRIIDEAFYLATTGRPGPVLIDLPKNVMMDTTPIIYEIPEQQSFVSIRGYSVANQSNGNDLDTMAEKLRNAARPLLLIGGGCVAGETPSLLLNLAERLDLPVASTLMGIGAFPSDHPLHLGMVGMHGTVAANRAIQAADVLVCLGVRFSDRVTGKRRAFSPHSYKIQVDIDEAEFDKNIEMDLALCDSITNVLQEMLNRLSDRKIPEWHDQINKWSRCPIQPFRDHHESRLTPQDVIRYVDHATVSDAIISTDVGQHQIWTAHHYNFKKPRTFLTSGGLGTMGYGFPAAIGAAVAFPERQVVCISGDGSFQMNMQEIMTAVDLQLNVKVVILKNGYLGMVRQWQELFLNKRYSAVQISSPDFAALAKSFGAQGYQASTKEEAKAIIQHAMNTEGPAIMEFDVIEETNVYPIVPPGASNDESIEG